MPPPCAFGLFANCYREAGKSVWGRPFYYFQLLPISNAGPAPTAKYPCHPNSFFNVFYFHRNASPCVLLGRMLSRKVRGQFFRRWPSAIDGISGVRSLFFRRVPQFVFHASAPRGILRGSLEKVQRRLLEKLAGAKRWKDRRELP